MKERLEHLEYFLVFLVEGMYERTEPDLSNYLKYCENYKAVISQYRPEKHKESMDGLKEDLKVILNLPNIENLNFWYCEYSMHYLESNERVYELLEIIWKFFFSDEKWIYIENNEEQE